MTDFDKQMFSGRIVGEVCDESKSGEGKTGPWAVARVKVARTDGKFESTNYFGFTCFGDGSAEVASLREGDLVSCLVDVKMRKDSKSGEYRANNVLRAGSLEIKRASGKPPANEYDDIPF